MVRIKRNLAIIIGIDQYTHIPQLKNAVFDAQELANVLQKRHNYQVLRLFDESATKEKFSKLLENLQNKKIELGGNLTQVEKSDRLLFYFAGHGFDQEAEDSEEDKPAGYFMPQDADANDNKTWLSMQKVYEILTNLDCHHLLMILDCCFAGRISWVSKGRNAARPRKLYKQNYDRYIKHSTQQIITSAAYDEKALDSFRFGKRGGEDSKHSPFAYFLLKILKADFNEGDDKFLEAVIDDKVITVHEVFTYLQNELGKVTEGQTSALIQPRKYDKEIGEYIFLKGEYIFPLSNFQRDKLEEFKLDENTNPYKGLASFEAKDSQLFHGRKQLIEGPKEGLIAKVSENRLTVVLGVSGSGKSSLVKAGLIPKLRSEEGEKANQEQWYVLNPIRPGEVPLTTLARAILPIKNVNLVNELTQVKFLDNLLNSEIKPEQESKLNDESKEVFNILLKAWSGEIREVKLLLILDNFEQLKKICNDSEKQLLEEFKQNISNTLNSLIEELKQDSQSLTAIVNQWSKNNPNIKLLLTIDQSEELITLCNNDQDRENFLRLLAGALASKELCQKLRIVLTLRSDFEPQIRDLNEDKYKDADWQNVWQKNWQDGRFIITPMNREELQEVIEEPAAQRTLFFESPKLVNALIDEVISMPGALPLLSFTLSQLYLKYLKAEENKEREDRTITEADYQDTGGVTRSLIKTADDTYNKLVNEEKVDESTIRDVILRMVAISGGELARRRVSMSELVYPEPKNEQVTKVIECFVEGRLLVTGLDTQGKEYVEPVHDALVTGWQKLLIWKQEHEESLILQRRLTPAAEEWESQQQARYLWNANPRLDLLKKVSKSDDNWLNQLEAEFVRRSVGRKSFNTRRNWIVLIAVILGLSGLTITALIGQRNALIEGVRAARQSAEANLQSGQELDALVASLRAAKTLETEWLLQLLKPNAKLQNEVTVALQKAVYTSREYNRLDGHAGRVNSIQFSPDPQMIVSGSTDGTVKLWSLNGKLLNNLKGEDTSVTAISISPDSQQIAAVHQNQNITVWSRNGKNWSKKDTIQNAQALADSIGGNDVSFSPNGQIASANVSGVKLWRRDKERYKAVTLNAVDVVNHNSVSFSPDGQIIAVANNKIELLSLEDGTLKKTLKGHTYAVNSVSFSPDGQMIASASADRTIKLWNLDGTLKKTFKGHTDAVNSVSFSPDGQRIASASNDNTIRLWSINSQERTKLDISRKGSQTLTPLFTNRYSYRDQPHNLRNWLPVGNALQSWSQNMEKFTNLLEHTDSIKDVTLSPDGQLIVLVSKDNTIKIWNQDKKKPKILDDDTNNRLEVSKITFSPNSQLIASFHKDENGKIRNIKIWNRDGQKIKDLDDREILDDCNQVVTFSPDGQLIVWVGEDHTIKIWNQDGKAIKTLVDDTNDTLKVSQITFSPNGQLIASVHKDKGERISNIKMIKIWNRNGKEIKVLDVKALSEKKVEVLDGSDGKSIIFSSDSQMIAFSTTLASDGKDLSVYLWHIDTQEIKTWQFYNGDYSVALPTHQGYNETELLKFSPDGQLIITVGEEETFKIWDIEGKLLKILQSKMPRSVESPDISVNGISFIPNTNILASISGKSIQFWELENQQLVSDIEINSQNLLALSISSNGKFLATVDKNQKITVLNLDIDRLLAQGCDLVRDYLQNNPNLSDNDRKLCDGISEPEKDGGNHSIINN